MFVRRVDKLQIQHPVIQVLFEERNIHEQSVQQSVGGGAGKTRCGICKRALNSSRSSAKMCLETSLVEFQPPPLEGIGRTWANCDVNLARLSCAGGQLRFWCPSFQIIIVLSNRRQFVVRSVFFFTDLTVIMELLISSLFSFITGLGWCITSLRCPQGRHVASDGSPHINSMQFAIMSKSVSMGCQNSFSIRPPLHSRVAMRSPGSGGRTASGLLLKASANSNRFSDFISRAEDKLLVPRMACPSTCTRSNWMETTSDHSSLHSARVQTSSRGSDLLIFPFSFCLHFRDGDIRSDTRSRVFCAVASRVQGDAFAYAAPVFAAGNGAVAFGHSSFTWHGLHFAGRTAGGRQALAPVLLSLSLLSPSVAC